MQIEFEQKKQKKPEDNEWTKTYDDIMPPENRVILLNEQVDKLTKRVFELKQQNQFHKAEIEAMSLNHAKAIRELQNQIEKIMMFTRESAELAFKRVNKGVF